MNERTNESMKEKQFPETAADGWLQIVLLSHESLIYKQLILTPSNNKVCRQWGGRELDFRQS